MTTAAIADLASLDRDVARAFAAWSRWRVRLDADPEACADEDPIEAYRHVAGQSTWRDLGELAVMTHDAPLRDALRRWVQALLHARLGRDLDVAWARAAIDPRGHFHGDPPRLVGFRDSWRGIVQTDAPGEAARWLDALVECAPPLAAIARERSARRVEIAERLGLDHPSSDATPVPLDALRTAARLLLARTDDIATHVLREGTVDATSPRSTDVIRLAVARDAGDGWPTHLTARWLDELFGAGAKGLDIALPRLPAAIGASSFARALGAFGFALRVAAGAKSPRFALAREPAFVAAHRFAFVFASLATSADFHRVALGASRRVALGQARSLARTALLDARVHAARFLLGDESAFAPRDLFEELGTRIFGVALPAALRGAWPAPRDDEPARLLALVTALPLARDLVDRFDSDWFANPRALPHLRALGAVPAREETRELDADAAATALARAFEEALA